MDAQQPLRRGSTSRGRARTVRRLALALATALTAVGALAGGIAASSHQGSATLSNGAQLAVSIDSPATGTEYVGTSVDVPVTGTASIGLGEAGRHDRLRDGLLGQHRHHALGEHVRHDPRLREGVLRRAQRGGRRGRVDRRGRRRQVRPRSPRSHSGSRIPTSAAVNTAINSGGPGGGTNCAAGLTDALTLVNASTNGTKIVVFASDGLCNAGANVTGPAGRSATAGAIVQSIAIGTGSSCSTDGGAGTLDQIAQNRGVCTEVPDPNNLPDIIQSLIGSTLESLTLTVDGTPTPISNAEIDSRPATPRGRERRLRDDRAGPHAGRPHICVTAAGSDVLGDSKTAQGCVTVQVVNLTATPATETNELGSDNSHTVTATIAGDPSVVAGRTVTFVVGGKNAGATGTCNPVDCTTNAAGQVTFTYTVPKADSSIGTDTIAVSAQLGTPPANGHRHRAEDLAGHHPAGPGVHAVGEPEREERARRLERGRVLPAHRDRLGDGDPNIVIRVNGVGRPDGSPFRSGDTMKYTQASDGTTPVSKTIGGPNSAVAAHVTSGGDATVTATDTSGNTATVTCLVPKPPK